MREGSLATVKIDAAWLARIMKHVPVLHTHTYFGSTSLSELLKTMEY